MFSLSMSHSEAAKGNEMQRGMNVLALVKDSERYVFLYDDESPGTLLQQLGRYASDPDLSFTWYDAAILSQKVRNQTRQSALLDTEEAPQTRFRKSA